MRAQSFAWRRAAWLALCLTLALYGLLNALPEDDLRDFGSIIAASRAASQGLDPYATYPLTFHVVLPGFESWNPDLNPPLSILLLQPLARLDPHLAFRLWWGFSVLCYLYALTLLSGAGATGRESRGVPGDHSACEFPIWGLALGGFWDTLVLGQIYLPLVLAAVMGWRLLVAGRDEASGMLIGFLVAMKPNFVIWPLLLLLAGRRRLAAIAIATALLLGLLPLLVYGPAIYRDWFHLLERDSGRIWFLTNVSLPGLAARAGLSWLGPPLGLGLIAFAAFWTIRNRLPAERASDLAVSVSLLASPIAWVHYTLFLLPVFAGRIWTPQMKVAALMLTLPVATIIPILAMPLWLRLSFGSLYGWAVLLVFWSVVRLKPPPKQSAGNLFRG